MKSQNYILIDCLEFNKWGFDLIDRTLKEYLNNDIQTSSIGYFHVVLTTFAVEALTSIGNFQNIHYTWLTEGYSEGVIVTNRQDYNARLALLWGEYKAAVKYLLSAHMTIEDNKSYTSEFINESTLKVAEVNVTVITDSVTAII